MRAPPSFGTPTVDRVGSASAGFYFPSSHMSPCVTARELDAGGAQSRPDLGCDVRPTRSRARPPGEPSAAGAPDHPRRARRGRGSRRRRRSSSSGGPSSTVTTQSWHARPRTMQVSQSIRVVMAQTLPAATDNRPAERVERSTRSRPPRPRAAGGDQAARPPASPPGGPPPTRRLGQPGPPYDSWSGPPDHVTGSLFTSTSTGASLRARSRVRSRSSSSGGSSNPNPAARPSNRTPSSEGCPVQPPSRYCVEASSANSIGPS